MALQAGSRLDPYEVVGLLASGGMGEVFGLDPPLDPLRSDPRFQELVRRAKFPS